MSHAKGKESRGGEGLEAPKGGRWPGCALTCLARRHPRSLALPAASRDPLALAPLPHVPPEQGFRMQWDYSRNPEYPDLQCISMRNLATIVGACVASIVALFLLAWGWNKCARAPMGGVRLIRSCARACPCPPTLLVACSRRASRPLLCAPHFRRPPRRPPGPPRAQVPGGGRLLRAQALPRGHVAPHEGHEEGGGGGGGGHRHRGLLRWVGWGHARCCKQSAWGGQGGGRGGGHIHRGLLRWEVSGDPLSGASKQGRHAQHRRSMLV